MIFSVGLAKISYNYELTVLRFQVSMQDHDLVLSFQAQWLQGIARSHGALANLRSINSIVAPV